MFSFLFLLSFLQPVWPAETVWYQIFPERFHNGDAGNDPTVDRVEDSPKGWHTTPWTQNWYFRDEWEQRFHPEFSWGVTRRRYGGDLQGIIEKLDYLQSLGVTGIYLNPVFDAVSMHKYDASSYHHIDRFFGSDPEGDAALMAQEDPADPNTWKWTAADKLFLEFLKKAHKKNIRVIIDGVFNHTGRDFWAFRGLRKRQENSPFAEWYAVKAFDNAKTEADEFDYRGWIGIQSLPEWKEEGENLAQPVKEHLFSVTRRWMDPNGDGDPSDGVDGWRLDVAAEVGFGFWEEWHRLVRRLNPRAFTVAEVWYDEVPSFLGKSRFDAVMDYRWIRVVDDFFVSGSLSASGMKEKSRQLLGDFGDRAALQLHLLESHDTERLASRVFNRDRSFKENSHAGEGFRIEKPDSLARAIQRQVSAFQFLAVGAPMLYYGVEAGMWGADDPDNRKPMLWPEFRYETERNHPFNRSRSEDDVAFDSGLFRFYQRLARLRALHPALYGGQMQIDVLGEQVVVLYRQRAGEKTVLGLFNAHSADTVVSLSHWESSSWIDWFAQQKADFSEPIHVPGHGFGVWVEE